MRSSFSGQAIETLQRSPFGRYRLGLDALRFQAEADGPALDGSRFVAELPNRLATNLSVERGGVLGPGRLR